MSSNPIVLPPYIKVTKNKAEIVTVDLDKVCEQFTESHLANFKSGKSDLRAKQLAASDWIVKGRIDPDAFIKRDAEGKPYLNTASNHISISHTKNILSLIHHPEIEVSVDIEFYDRELVSISPRFTDDEEVGIVSKCGISNPHIVIWSIKECLFKILGRKGVHFLTDLRIVDSTCNDLTIKTECLVKHHDLELRYLVNSFIFEPILLSYIDESPFQ